MAEDNSFVFNLSTANKSQSLKISIIDDRISLILENKSANNEIYFSEINLSQLKQVCKAFKKMNSLKQAFLLLADTIEAGNIFLIENKDTVNLKLTIKTKEEEYPAFNIELILDEEQNNDNEQIEQEQEQVQEYEKKGLKNNVQILPVKFDYQGNLEAEEKYGQQTKNTTEYNKPIIKSDYKQPIVQLEYIEPILQVHYPDGTTKSKALPPRIQTIDGKTPDINEEQFRYIREQMNKSVGRGENKSHYSTGSVPVSSFNNIINALTDANNANNTTNNEDEDIREVEPQTQYQSQIQTQYGQNLSQYSTRSVNNAPVYNSMQQQEFYNKRNVLSRSPPRNKTIEVAPRMINKSQNVYSNYSNSYNIQNNAIYNQYQNAIAQSQIVNPITQNNIRSNAKNGSFAQVIPLKKIKRPQNQQSQIVRQRQQQQQVIPVKYRQPKPQVQMYPQTQEKPYEYDPNIIHQQLAIPYVYKAPSLPQQEDTDESYEYNMEQQRERYQSQLRMQQELVNSKTPIFPSILPTKIMDTKFEFPQGKDYEERLLSEIKAQDKGFQPIYNTQYNESQYEDQYYQNNQSIQSQVLPIIYQQNNIQGNEDINQQIKQQIQSYNEKNIDKMNDMKVTTQNIQNDYREEDLENNEIIEDNENNQEEENQEECQEENQQEKQEENPDEDIEALFRSEDGYIIFRNGILRGIIHKYSEIDEIISRIQDKLMKGAKFNLLYKAFTHGDKASTFHEKCDKHPITLVLIETTEGVRFGGFTKKSWDGKHLKKKDNDAFVFSIDTGKCFDVKKDEPAIGCYPKFGPVFFGCQIRIYDDFFTKGGTTCYKGLNYNTNKDYELNNGKKTYIVKDMEVYEIETIDI